MHPDLATPHSVAAPDSFIIPCELDQRVREISPMNARGRIAIGQQPVAGALWGSIGQGSIYHALRHLVTKGQLCPIDDGTNSEGPARTRYRVTDDGRHTFTALLERTLSSGESTPEETVAAIGFLTDLTRARAVELLERRLDALRKRRDRVVQEHEQNLAASWGHHVEAINFWNQTATAELAWTSELIDTLRAGAYTMHDERPTEHPRQNTERPNSK